MSKISPEAWARARDPEMVAEREGLRYKDRDPRLPNPSIMNEVVVPADPGEDPGDPDQHCDCRCGVQVVLIGEDGSTRMKGPEDEYDCRESSWVPREDEDGR